jgi:iron complex outermembrane receptor protein
MATGIVNSTTSPSVLQFSTTNVGPSKGNESITEGAVEFAVPILKDLPYAEDLDLDLGYRFAQYSISGSAQTWKIGGSYVPIDELRIRGTISRDFRAPNLYELFAGPSATFGNFNDAIHSGTSAYLNTYSVGNPQLKPEIGQTSTIGVVWTPDYVPGFSAALDYYTVSIDNEIAKLSSANVDTLCQQSNGVSPLCAYIVRPTPFSNMTTASFPTYIDTIPINQGYVRQAGLDLDTSYNLALDNFSLFPDATSSVNFRFVGNYTESILTFAGLGSPVLQSAGAGATPKIKFNFSTNFLDGPVNLGFRIRYIGRDVYSLNPATFYSYNGGVESEPVAYFDLNAAYKFSVDGHQFELYGNINNLFNTFVFAPQGNGINENYPTNMSLYDVVGRDYNLGIRFNL